MKKILLLLAGLTGVLVGLGLIMPSVALWRSGSPETAWIVGPLVLGSALATSSLVLVKVAWKRV